MIFINILSDIRTAKAHPWPPSYTTTQQCRRRGKIIFSVHLGIRDNRCKLIIMFCSDQQINLKWSQLSKSSLVMKKRFAPWVPPNINLVWPLVLERPKYLSGTTKLCKISHFVTWIWCGSLCSRNKADCSMMKLIVFQIMFPAYSSNQALLVSAALSNDFSIQEKWGRQSKMKIYLKLHNFHSYFRLPYTDRINLETKKIWPGHHLEKMDRSLFLPVSTPASFAKRRLQLIVLIDLRRKRLRNSHSKPDNSKNVRRLKKKTMTSWHSLRSSLHYSKQASWIAWRMCRGFIRMQSYPTWKKKSPDADILC